MDAPHEGKRQEEAPSGNSGQANVHAHQSPLVQGRPPVGNGGRLGGCQCHPALIPLHRYLCSPWWARLHYLLSYAGQPICSI